MRYDRSEELKAYKEQMLNQLKTDVPGFEEMLGGQMPAIVGAAFVCGASAYSNVYDAKPEYGEMTKGC